MSLTRPILPSLLAGLMLAGGVTHAAPIEPTVTTDPRDPRKTLAIQSISNTTVTGADMVGMQVTAYFDDSSSESEFWQQQVDGSDGVQGEGWSLALTGDTYAQGVYWYLKNDREFVMTKLIIDAWVGGIVFDILAGAEGTPGSLDGLPFSDVDGPSALTVSAVYRNQVNLNDNFYRDL